MQIFLKIRMKSLDNGYIELLGEPDAQFVCSEGRLYMQYIELSFDQLPVVRR